MEDEVTPVQAWNYIRRHPSFDSIDVERLRKLTGKLLKEVKCYGYVAFINAVLLAKAIAKAQHRFGAVIEQDVLENMVFDAVVVGKVFST